MLTKDVNKKQDLPKLYREIQCHHCGSKVFIAKNITAKTFKCSKCYNLISTHQDFPKKVS